MSVASGNGRKADEKIAKRIAEASSGNSNLLSSGFESPSELIGYCELHCKTDRALFSSNQVNDMLRLAGHPPGFAESVPDGEWSSLHWEMEELCRIAKKRLAG